MKKFFFLLSFTLSLGLVTQVHAQAPWPARYYQRSLVYIGESLNDLSTGLQDTFQKNSIWFTQVNLSDQTIFSEDEISPKISENIGFLKTADWIVVNSKNFDTILQVISKLNVTNSLTLNKKEIFLISDVNQNFIKRIISKYLQNLWINKISVLDTDYAPILLSNIAFNRKVTEQPYIKSIPLVFKEMPRYYPISYIIDFLIYKWFPINLVGLILILCASVLLITIFRQVVWFSVFGIYSPLLFTVSLYLLGIQPALFLFAIALLSTLLIRFLTTKLYLLHSAKVSLLVILYFFLTIVVLGLDSLRGTNLINLEIFTNGFIIFPILFLIIVSDKIFNEWFKIFSKWRWISFAEFLVVSFAIYALMTWTWFKHLLLSYPELILVIFVANILVGRFTWLQVLEYLRFMPLIKKHLEGEEE